MYLCNRLKSCRNSRDCGKACVMTKDKDYEYVPQVGTVIECRTVGELVEWKERLRATNLAYTVDGFKIVFVE